MIARIRKSIEEKDKGFTLIELLVVMIIIGILAAIAIPVFLNQRKKAQDTAATSDVSTLGKEVATYYVDATAALATSGVTFTAPSGTTAGKLNVNGASVGNASAATNGVVLAKQTFTNDTTWCVSATNANGDKAKTGYRYSAAGGLEEGVCP